MEAETCARRDVDGFRDSVTQWFFDEEEEEEWSECVWRDWRSRVVDNGVEARREVLGSAGIVRRLEESRD